jgi:DNA polymerase-3 subunit delta'
LDRALLDLATLYRDVLLLQSNSTDSLINQDLIEQINQIAVTTSPAKTLDKIEAILRARTCLIKNSATLLTMEALMLQLKA